MWDGRGRGGNRGEIDGSTLLETRKLNRDSRYDPALQYRQRHGSNGTGQHYGPTSSLEGSFDNLANIVGILNSEGTVGTLETSPRWICAMEE